MKKIEEKIIWQSKIFTPLVMTDMMLQLLHYRYSNVTSWHQMMLDLEKYLVLHPNKQPQKDWKKFVLNCAKRHSEDVRSGKRFADGKVNLKAFSGPLPTPKRDESFTKEITHDEITSLREQLSHLERGTEAYEDTLERLEKLKKQRTQPMAIGDIFAKIQQMAGEQKQ